jgi:DNA-binding IclR family transcriptional regulator
MPKKGSWSTVPIVEDIATAPMAVRSAARAFRVIEFFDEIRRPARANEIAGRLGIPQSSASLLLNSMARLGYLDFDVARKTYLPSLRTAVLATWRDNGHFRDGTVVTMLENLAHESGLAACLTSRAGIFVQYLTVVQHPRPGDVHITLTARRYAARSAAGLVLLSALEDAEIRSIIHRTRAQDDPDAGSITFKDATQRVARARQDGYCVSLGLVNAANGAVAMALPQHVTGGWQQMAVSLAGRVDRVEASQDRLVAILRDAIRVLGADRSS